jgi:flagellar biosynthesis chaperone FliJ
MDNTHNQDLQAAINQKKDSLQHVTYNLSSTNSLLEKFQDQFQQQFDAMEARFMDEFDTLKFVVNHLLNLP